MKLEHRSGWKTALCAVAVASMYLSTDLARAEASAAHVVAQDSVAAPVRYARAKSSGVKMYNLADTKAEVVLTLPADGIIAVYSERAGFLEAEAPQSLEVWVYGKFVKPTSDPSLLEVTENLLMRPLPSSEEKSYPLAQRLHKGERVRMIERADASKAFKDDWIKIYAPPGTRAWVQASQTQPLAAGADALAAWAGAVKAAQATQAAALSSATPALAKSAENASATKAPGAGDALEEATKLLNAAKAAAEPDYAPARAAFQKIVEDSPKSTAADSARLSLDKIDVLEQIERLKHDAKLVEQKRHEELEKANARLHELSLKQDPLWGRFQTRGWVEYDGSHYWIHWSGKNASELECQNGRYQLADYVGFEVGVMGITRRAAIAESGATAAQPPLFDVTRIEVISGRMN
jgi:hypothetical protein